MSTDTVTFDNFIKAKSAKRLRKLMSDNKSRLNMSVLKYQITHDGKDFYAWYDEPIWKSKDLEDK